MDTGSSGGRAVVVVSLSTAPDESSRSSRGTAPGVECAVDPLYVVQWVIDVLDEIRREAWRGCEG